MRRLAWLFRMLLAGGRLSLTTLRRAYFGRRWFGFAYRRYRRRRILDRIRFGGSWISLFEIKICQININIVSVVCVEIDPIRSEGFTDSNIDNFAGVVLDVCQLTPFAT